jgi:hypothetical protein
LTEILTESFCERCGTRYTFESAGPRRSRIGKVRTLSKGMKNFVLSDDSSFSEAMAEARSEQELAAVTHQLDAFHQTFNFCLTCRQYTCGDCWNDEDGRCLTCAPIPGRELPAHTHDVVAETVALEPEAEPAAADGAEEAWPDADLSAGRLSRALGLDEAEVEATVDAVNGHEELADHPGIAAAAVVAAASTPEPVGSEQYKPEAEPEQVPVAGLAPGQSLEDAIAAYEASLVGNEVAEVVEAAEVAAPEALAEPIEPEVVIAAAGIVDAPVEDEHDPLRAAIAAAALASTHEDHEHDAPGGLFAPEPEPVVEPEPEPVAATAEVVPEPEPEPVAAAEPEFLAEPARVDVVPQPAWPEPATSIDAPVAPVAAPEAPGAPINPWLTVAPEDGDAPQWPATPAWPTAPSGRDLPASLAGRPLLPLDDASGVWAASAREVLTGAAQAPVPQAAAAAAATAQPCVSCGLSLSANARFCRRCGTRQG